MGVHFLTRISCSKKVYYLKWNGLSPSSVFFFQSHLRNRSNRDSRTLIIQCLPFIVVNGEPWSPSTLLLFWKQQCQGTALSALWLLCSSVLRPSSCPSCWQCCCQHSPTPWSLETKYSRQAGAVVLVVLDKHWCSPSAEGSSSSNTGILEDVKLNLSVKWCLESAYNQDNTGTK